MEALMSLSGFLTTENPKQLTSLLDKLYEREGYSVAAPEKKDASKAEKHDKAAEKES